MDCTELWRIVEDLKGPWESGQGYRGVRDVRKGRPLEHTQLQNPQQPSTALHIPLQGAMGQCQCTDVVHHHVF